MAAPTSSYSRSKLLVLLLLCHHCWLMMGIESATEGIDQSAVVCQAPCQLFLFTVPQRHRHWTAGPLHSEAPSRSHTQAAVGRQGQVARKIAPTAPYLRCVLFIFPICCCPRTEASATAQLHGGNSLALCRGLHQWLGCRGTASMGR